MEHFSLAFIWLCQFHVVVCSGTDIFYILHIIIDTFDHVMTGRTKSYQILTFFFGLIQSTDGRKFCGNLIRTKWIYTTAALPVVDFFQFKSQCPCRYSGICIQISCFCSQGTTRKITVLHSSCILSLCKFPACRSPVAANRHSLLSA